LQKLTFEEYTSEIRYGCVKYYFLEEMELFAHVELLIQSYSFFTRLNSLLLEHFTKCELLREFETLEKSGSSICIPLSDFVSVCAFMKLDFSRYVVVSVENKEHD
jgi:hypothetical protein